MSLQQVYSVSCNLLETTSRKVLSDRFWNLIPSDFAIISSFSRSEEMGEMLEPIIERFVDEISLSSPLLAF